MEEAFKLAVGALKSAASADEGYKRAAAAGAQAEQLLVYLYSVARAYEMADQRLAAALAAQLPDKHRTALTARVGVVQQRLATLQAQCRAAPPPSVDTQRQRQQQPPLVQPQPHGVADVPSASGAANATDTLDIDVSRNYFQEAVAAAKLAAQTDEEHSQSLEDGGAGMLNETIRHYTAAKHLLLCATDARAIKVRC
eukprot:COSAG01_NODE_25_length_37050_cov_211.559119_25_plen_197_part_00